MHDPADIASFFDVPGEYVDGAPYGSGHINDTYACRWRLNGEISRYIIQRINRHVFAAPAALMENVERVTRHLRHKLEAIPGADPDRECMTLLYARDGGRFFRDDEGDYWRAFRFVEGTETFDVCTSPSQAYEAARAFGRFQRLLADLPDGPLHETYPFSITPPGALPPSNRRWRRTKWAGAPAWRRRLSLCGVGRILPGR